MMKAPDLRDRLDATSIRRLNLAGERTIAIKRAVATRPLVIRDVRAEDAFEMGFAENDYMVKAFSADGADQPLCEWILPRRTRGCQHFLDPHTPQLAAEAVAINGVASRIRYFGA